MESAICSIGHVRSLQQCGGQRSVKFFTPHRKLAGAWHCWCFAFVLLAHLYVYKEPGNARNVGRISLSVTAVASVARAIYPQPQPSERQPQYMDCAYDQVKPLCVDKVCFDSNAFLTDEGLQQALKALEALKQSLAQKRSAIEPAPAEQFDTVQVPSTHRELGVLEHTSCSADLLATWCSSVERSYTQDRESEQTRRNVILARAFTSELNCNTGALPGGNSIDITIPPPM